MSMDDLFDAMKEGDEPEEGEERAGNPLADLLGGLAGGGAGEAEAGGAGDLLGSLLGGGAAGSPGGAGAAGDLLGSLLGGGAQSTPSPPSGGGGLGGLLGGLLGGGGVSGSGGGGMGGLLGGLLGGGGSQPAANPLVQSIANAVADKLGLSPEIAAVAVSLVLNKLLAALSGGREAAPAEATAGAPGGFDLSQMLSQFSGGKTVDADFLRSSGLMDEMTEQAGVDEETAEASLQEVFSLLGSQAAGSSPDVDLGGSEGGLDDLLGSW